MPVDGLQEAFVQPLTQICMLQEMVLRDYGNCVWGNMLVLKHANAFNPSLRTVDDIREVRVAFIQVIARDVMSEIEQLMPNEIRAGLA